MCKFLCGPLSLVKGLILFPLKLMAFISGVVFVAYLSVVLCALVSKDGYDWLSYTCTAN